MQTVDVLRALLECAEDALTEFPVCRSFINPGDDAAHDVCSRSGENDGQLWVAHLGSTPGWPSPTGEPTTCTTAWAEQIEIGIVRCARGKVTDQGTAPTVEQIIEDAENQERDRLILRQVILCCMPVEGKDLVVRGWEPIPPQGGCVGGLWTFAVRDAGCACGSLES